MTYKKYITSAILSAFIATASFAENTSETSPQRFCNISKEEVEACILQKSVWYFLAKSSSSRYYPLSLQAFHLARLKDVETTKKIADYIKGTSETDAFKNLYFLFNDLAHMHKEPSYEIAQKAMSYDLSGYDHLFSENMPLYIYEILLTHNIDQANQFFDEYVWPWLIRGKISPFVYIRFLQEKGDEEKLADFKQNIPIGHSQQDIVKSYLSYCDITQAYSAWTFTPSKEREKILTLSLQMGIGLIQKQEFAKAFKVMKNSYEYSLEQKQGSKRFGAVAKELAYYPDGFKEASKFFKPIDYTEDYARALYRKGHKDKAALLNFENKEDILNAEEINRLIHEAKYEKADEKLSVYIINGELSEQMDFVYLDPIIHMALIDNEISHKYREIIHNRPLASYAIDIFAKYESYGYAAMALTNIIRRTNLLGMEDFIKDEEYEFPNIKNSLAVTDNFIRYIKNVYGDKTSHPASWDFDKYNFEYNANYCRDKVH